LLLVFSFSASIYSQEPGTARRQPNNPSTASTSAETKSSANSRVSGAVVKSDVAEALSVIESNYVDGKKLDYNAIFKSSIGNMLNSLDPHSNYLDAADFAAFRTEQRSEYFGIAGLSRRPAFRRQDSGG
jgi:carboxyl-terminal processing protease